MQLIKVKTRIFNPPKDDLYELFGSYLPSLKNGDVLLITSKILSIHQGRSIKKEGVDKDDLIAKEADRFIPRSDCPDDAVVLTIKDHTLIPSAGIDESNAKGNYILWPKDVNKLAGEICDYLKKVNQIENLGVVVTDSHCVPLRYGVVGISIGFAGINPLRDYRGKKDIFGRELKMTQTNIVDNLAAVGALLMGEADEQVPIVIVRGADFVEFTDENKYRDFIIPFNKDIYYPLLKNFLGPK